MNYRDIGCAECRRVSSGNCGRHETVAYVVTEPSVRRTGDITEVIDLLRVIIHLLRTRSTTGYHIAQDARAEGTSHE